MQQASTILHVCDTLSVGGAERLILGLAQQIDRSRFAVRVCALGSRRGNLLQPELERAGVAVEMLGAQRFYDPGALAGVVRAVRTHKVDLIHTHLTSADVIGRIAGKLTGRPVVSTLHNEPYDYDRQRRDRRALQRLTARHGTAMLVAVSEHLRELYIERWGLPPERVTAILNAVPLAPFLEVEAPPERSNGQLTITTIGRLSPQKAHDVLLEAAALLFARRPGLRLRLVGQGRLEGDLRAQAARLGIAERVEFAGVRNDVANVLAQSDIFVLSSRWEGVPVTAAEAMAAARPVVLTDVGGCRDLIRHGVHGLLVPPDNPAALAAALEELADSPARRRELGMAARERARRELDMGTFALRHEALYSDVLARHGGARHVTDSRRASNF